MCYSVTFDIGFYHNVKITMQNIHFLIPYKPSFNQILLFSDISYKAYVMGTH